MRALRGNSCIHCLILAFLFVLPACHQKTPTNSLPLKNNVAVTAHPLATQAAVAIYKNGGNAIDAAVAAGFALGVVEPQNSGLGGGGFMLITLAKEKETIALDYREVAPQLPQTQPLSRLGEMGEQRLSSTIGYRASGVPGQVAGFSEAVKSYGKLSLKETISPALQLAENGFPVSPVLAKRLKEREPCLGNFLSTRRVFFKGNQVLQSGSNLIQTNLAATLSSLSDHGPTLFYKGSIAKLINYDMIVHEGLIRLKDLETYQVKRRKPTVINYRGYEIQTMPLPSSGGILFEQMFQSLKKRKPTPQNLVSIMKEGFQVRTKLGGIDTTHAVFADREGNVVSMTNSLNLSFGSCVVIEGTGILMNNTMDDFATDPGEPNAFGLIQGDANKIEPGKRPLSSMSPTIVFKNGKPIYALGSPGGPTIISNIFQVLIDLIDHKVPLDVAIQRPKLHHQAFPNVLQYQSGTPEKTIESLKKLGYKVEEKESWGNFQGLTIDWKKKRTIGVSDPRGEGIAF